MFLGDFHIEKVLELPGVLRPAQQAHDTRQHPDLARIFHFLETVATNLFSVALDFRLDKLLEHYLQRSAAQAAGKRAPMFAAGLKEIDPAYPHSRIQSSSWKQVSFPASLTAGEFFASTQMADRIRLMPVALVTGTEGLTLAWRKPAKAVGQRARLPRPAADVVAVDPAAA